MAATVHFNLLTAVINGVNIIEPLGMDITYESQSAASTSSSDAYSQHLNVGPKSRSVTVTGLDPKTLMDAAVAAAGSCVFTYKQAGDVTTNESLTVADGATSKAVGSSFEWDSGNPGEFGQASATFIISGSVYTQA